jgi:uncharacterized protein YutE (UPF0331/DUF86 family)
LASYDEEKVTALSSQVLLACERLRELRTMKKEIFAADPHRVASAKYHLIVGIEAAIDLSNHVIAKNRWRAPDDYADTFRILEEHGFFDAAFAARMQDMARFRNRLIHLYWNIDTDQIYEILQKDISDIKRFLEIYIKKIQSA